jgi:hypothetical protein
VLDFLAPDFFLAPPFFAPERAAFFALDFFAPDFFAADFLADFVRPDFLAATRHSVQVSSKRTASLLSCKTAPSGSSLRFPLREFQGGIRKEKKRPAKSLT